MNGYMTTKEAAEKWGITQRQVQNHCKLEVSYDNKEATCTMNADGSWLVILDGVITDDIALSVIANGRLLPNVTLKVKVQGISKNDDLFGGMGL